MSDNRIFFRIEDEDEKRVDELNTKYLRHLTFAHGSYAGMHCWNFPSKEEAKKATRIIKEVIKKARKE